MGGSKLGRPKCWGRRKYVHLNTLSSIGVLIAPMTSQNGDKGGRHGSKMAAMAPIQDGVQDQLRVMTSDEPVTRSVSPRKVS